ncbi:hypothetical protein J6590_076169 [Homalodisca vitripennis]|nr:hypothetical protein J6590_076169 [Homalodisca vitripennis]
MRDLNIDALDNTHHSTVRLVDLLRSFDLELLVKTPTRVTPTTQSATDNIITNHPSVAVPRPSEPQVRPSRRQSPAASMLLTPVTEDELHRIIQQLPAKKSNDQFLLEIDQIVLEMVENYCENPTWNVRGSINTDIAK